MQKKTSPVAAYLKYCWGTVKASDTETWSRLKKEADSSVRLCRQGYKRDKKNLRMKSAYGCVLALFHHEDEAYKMLKSYANFYIAPHRDVDDELNEIERVHVHNGLLKVFAKWHDDLQHERVTSAALKKLKDLALTLDQFSHTSTSLARLHSTIRYSSQFDIASAATWADMLRTEWKQTTEAKRDSMSIVLDWDDTSSKVQRRLLSKANATRDAIELKVNLPRVLIPNGLLILFSFRNF